MKTIRTLQASKGEERRELAVIQKADGSYWLHDVTADPTADSLEEIQDDSDTAVMDAIRANGFEVSDICPACGQVNPLAHEDGAVDGPREYHAACWHAMADDEQRAALDN